MDRAREDISSRKRRKWLIGLCCIGLIVAAGAGLASLKPALPTVPRSSLLIETVKRGELVRDVRGPGTLVPKEIRWIAARTGAHVNRIVLKAGASVDPDSVILELSSPEADADLAAARSGYTAAVSDYSAKETDLRSRLLDQKSSLAAVQSDYETTRMQAEAEEPLAKSGVIPKVQYSKSLVAVAQLKNRVEIERERMIQFERNISAQLASEKLRLDQLAHVQQLKQADVDALYVRAGNKGVLQRVAVDEGQQVAAGTNLARVATGSELMAELRIPETQAKDVERGQKVQVDTRNGVAEGTVLRIDPAVREGTVQVDVQLRGELPAGARADLSVDGIIELEKLTDVTYVSRPAFGQPNSKLRLFRLDADGTTATSVPVAFGKASVNFVQVQSGVTAGDRVVVSDTTGIAGFDKVRLN